MSTTPDPVGLTATQSNYDFIMDGDALKNLDPNAAMMFLSLLGVDIFASVAETKIGQLSDAQQKLKKLDEALGAVLSAQSGAGLTAENKDDKSASVDAEVMQVLIDAGFKPEENGWSKSGDPAVWTGNFDAFESAKNLLQSKVSSAQIDTESISIEANSVISKRDAQLQRANSAQQNAAQTNRSIG